MATRPDNKALYLLRLSAVLLLIGIGFRVVAAWWYRNAYNPDYGIVVLMVRHILAGHPWPTFFYGQAYMGTLEPLVSALLAAVAGPSGFVICLGTALFGIALLFVVRLWARDIAGREAGVAALLFCIIGPAGYIHYLASPRGGYAAVMLLGCLVMWWGARLLAREQAGRGARASTYLLLGIVAGAGFWGNFLIAPALATVGLAFLIWRRHRVLAPRILAAIPGFAIGSAPVWIWNLRHACASFAMTESMGAARPPLCRAIRLMATSRLIALMDVQGTLWILQTLVLLSLIGLILLSILAFRGAAPQRSRVVSRLALAMALLYLPIFLLAFCSSQYALIHTSRYLLPLIPVMGVLVGVGTARLNALCPKGLGWTPLALLLLWQGVRVPLHLRRAELSPEIATTSVKLADDLEALGVTDLYAKFFHFSLNYLTDERACFSDPAIERYLPYRQRLELSTHPAILENLGGVEEYLAATGGSATFLHHVRGRLHHSFVPPDEALEEIDPAHWRSVTGTLGDALETCLNDRRLDTQLHASLPLQHPESVTIQFDTPQTLSAVRAYSADGPYPVRWRVDLQAPGDEAFRPATDIMPVSNLFWSGPRLFWGGTHYRMACRFAPHQAQAIRIWFDKDPNAQTYALGELQLLGPTTLSPRPLDADTLMLLLQSRTIRRLYADRWVANRVHVTSGGAIWTQREPSAFPDAALGGAMRFSADMAIACPSEGVRSLRACLDQRGIRMRESSIGTLGILFDFGPRQWQNAYAEIPGITFHGAYTTVGQHKLWADRIYRSVMAQPPVNPEMLERALAIYPQHSPSAEALAAVWEHHGLTDKAHALRDTLRAQTTPRHPSRITFANGVQFEGLTLERTTAAPGQTIPIVYFWRCRPDVSTDQLAVFLHLEFGASRLQDDHVLLAEQDTALQPFDEVFREERLLAIPPGTEPGTYALRLGLYHRAPPSRRVGMKTALPHHFRAAVLPVQITVTPPEAP